MQKPTIEELQAFSDREFPENLVLLERVGEGKACARQSSSRSRSRPGNTVSGPTLMALADHVTYMVILSEIGIVPLAVTTNLNISFLRKPVLDRDLVAEASLVKLGKRLAVAEVRIASDGDENLVAHATVTYSIPPRELSPPSA